MHELFTIYDTIITSTLNDTIITQGPIMRMTVADAFIYSDSFYGTQSILPVKNIMYNIVRFLHIRI